MIEPRSILYTFFGTGDVPTAEQFADLIDSYIHQEDDNVTIYVVDPTTGEKRFGIGTLEPDAPLGITAKGVNADLSAFNKDGEADATWFFNLDPAAAGNLGLNVDQVVASGRVSRLFIQENDGFIGLGTTTPDQKLHIQESTGLGNTGIRLINTATAANNGFVIGHGQSAVTEQDGALSFYENTPIDANNRVTIRAGGNVGINVLDPDSRLHVVKPLSDVSSDIGLVAGTGIMTVGEITTNTAYDYRGIQARTGSYDAVGFLTLLPAELNLQRLGGNILIHGDTAIPDSSKILITDNGRIGVGTLVPAESIHTIGAITIGTTAGTTNGTIRYTGTDFEGLVGGVWTSMTGSAPPPPFSPWVAGPGNSIYYLAASDSRVGVGTSTPDCTLDIDNGETTPSGDNIAAIIYNHGQAADPSTAGNRVNMKLFNNNAWAGRTDIGLYVSEVSGAVDNASNIAALFNGNVAIGDVSTSEYLGSGANRVLSIQNGTAPAVPSATAIAVQIYSQNLPGTTLPTLHVMRANGEVVKLYKEIGLPQTDSSVITSTYDSVTQGVIENLRERLLQLENRLMNQGLLADPVPVP